MGLSALLSPFGLCLNPDLKDFKDGRNVCGTPLSCGRKGRERSERGMRVGVRWFAERGCARVPVPRPLPRASPASSLRLLAPPYALRRGRGLLSGSRVRGNDEGSDMGLACFDISI